MPALAPWVLKHKRLVIGFWVAVTIAAFAAIGPAGKSLSQQFGVPGREGFETNQQIAANAATVTATQNPTTSRL